MAPIPAQFFAGRPESRRFFDALCSAVESAGPASLRVTKSQVALRRRDDSPRWKQIVEPAPGRFMHHLELRSARQIDGQVRAWLREAWSEAGPSAAGSIS